MDEVDKNTAHVRDNNPLDGSQDDKPTENLEGQVSPHFETAPNQKSPQTKRLKVSPTQADVHDSMSNTSLSQTKILALKRKDPTEAFKRL